MGKSYDADVRYGSTFLDIGKNNKSINGEVLSDKLTGEIYLKRPSDGKIISFRQKSHTAYEAIQEFNIQFQSSTGFIYPEDPGSYLLGTKIRVDEFLQNEDKTDILLENHVFSKEINGEKDFRFSLSPKTNGFYLKPITRPGDSNICGYLHGLFSKHEKISFGTVVRSFTDWLDLSPLYESAYLYTEWRNFSNWASSNALLDYTLKVVGASEDGTIITNEKNVTTPIQMNEYSFISFSDDYNEEIQTVYSIDVCITKIYSPKLQYERYLANDSSSSSGIAYDVDRMMEVDDKVVLQSVDVFYFISDGSMLPTNENTIINHCFDVDFLMQAIVSLSTSSGSRSFQTQVERPAAWPVDTIWAEELREIKFGNQVEETDSETKFEELERELYHDPDDTLTYSDQISNAESILITSMSL